MNLYFTFLIFNIVMTVFSKNIRIRSGLETPIPRSIGLKFFTEIRNNNRDDYLIDVYPEDCCLDSLDTKCNIVKIMGSASEVIPGGATKSLTMVAPLLDLYDRKGYCTLYVDSRLVTKPKNVVRDTITIKFNTKIKKGTVPDNIKICKHLDEDPLNECKPVNCDIYYNGRRSFYNLIKKRCVAVPTCANAYKTAYNHLSNKCIYSPAVSKEDIDYVKRLSQSDGQRLPKSLMIIKITNMSNDMEKGEDINQETQPETTSLALDIEKEDTNIDKEKEINELKPKAKPKAKEKSYDDFAEVINKHKTIKPKLKEIIKPTSKFTAKLPCKDERINNILRYISTNRYTMMILTGVIFIQCCLICTLVYCITKSCDCFKKKHIVNRFFNYRHDASVTTPLIGTSNVDTETTEYQYISESSNYIDNKIKCYKACQKERKNNMKLSMSDDILSKCITRRDWRRLPRSETIPEVNNDDEILHKERKDVQGCQKRATEMKVNFQEEYQQDKKAKIIKSIFKKDSKSNADNLSDTSEREIRCHNYNYDNGSNITGFKRRSHCNFEVLQSINQEKKKSDSIEKGAQAYFSNDSIDDFISERGVIFIRDNASKYSFSSASSAAKSSVSSRSSRTSKNNIVQNVITLLSRKTKGPASDPGTNKSKTELDLELLHLSRASVFTSSNETDEGKDVKRIKDSNSSL